jgi:SAM-dependent methyltransferase
MSEAERFYQRSHEISLKTGKNAPTLDQVVRDLSRGDARYSCVLQHLRENPGRTVLELGYGDLTTALALARHARSYTIVDIVPRHDRSNIPDNMEFRQANLNEDFPFQEAKFDTVVAMMVIEHLFDPFHAFREVRRVVRPGGSVLVNLPNVASLRCRWQLAMGRLPITSTKEWFRKEEWDGNHLHYFTVSETIRLARHCGLEFVRLFPVGNHAWLKRRAPQLLCHEISFEFVRPS